MQIGKTFTVEAAHLLPNVPPGHKCARLHGHSFGIEVWLEGKMGAESGWVVDYAVIDEAFAPLFDQLDHHYMNEIEGLENPTSEHLARWIWRRLSSDLDGLCKVVVRETCNTACAYRGDDESGDTDPGKV